MSWQRRRTTFAARPVLLMSRLVSSPSPWRISAEAVSDSFRGGVVDELGHVDWALTDPRENGRGKDGLSREDCRRSEVEKHAGVCYELEKK